ncbi:CAP domain-containing protein [Paenibacillus ginsengarvi]
MSVMAGAGSAYAAPAQPTNSTNDLLNRVTAQTGFSLDELLQNVQKQGWNVRVVYPQWNCDIPSGDYGNGWHQGGGTQTPDNGSNQGTDDGSDSGQAGNEGNAGSGSNAGTGTGNQAGTGQTGNGSASENGGDTTTTASAYADQVVSLVNQERAKAGLSPLASDPALTNMALDKAKDMYNNNYFDHTSPTYGSPFDMMRSYGIHYSYAGENIAKGQRNPQEVMNAWMNSEGHRANIMSPNFTKIGVAYYNGEWVQEFIAN